MSRLGGRYRLLIHAVGLTVVLVALLPLVGTDGLFSADEGAAIAQATQVADGDGWLRAHPFPQADPDNKAFPLELADQVGDRFAPFAKHPLYVYMLVGADRVGGVNAMVLLSIAGTVVAAALAALVARHFDESMDVIVLWTVGLLSPLFFDGYVVIAHTLGAAVAALAALAAVKLIERRNAVLWTAVLAAALFVCVLLRTEGVLLGLGVAAGLLFAGKRVPARWWAAGAAVVAVGAARTIEPRWTEHLIGSITGASTPIDEVGRGGIGDHVFAGILTTIIPSYDLDAGAALGVLVVVLTVVAMVIARKRPDDDGAVVFLVAAAVVALLRIVIGGGPVPGLLIAFPIIGACAVFADRDVWRDDAGRVLLVSAGVFFVLVQATQYETGGSGEWGARYLALGIPFVVPVLVPALARGLRPMPHRNRRLAVAALAVVSLGLAGLAVRTLHDYRGDVAGLTRQIERATAAAPAGDGGTPVVIATNGAAARFNWDLVRDQRWLTVPDERVPEYVDRLRGIGVQNVTVVSKNDGEWVVRSSPV